MVDKKNIPQPTRSRLGLLALIALFLLPMILAWVVFQKPDWHPARGNYGELIEPPRLLDVSMLHQLDGTSLGPDFLRARWTLLHIGPSHCDSACQRDVYESRQVRLSLGKDMYRVQRLFVLADTEHLAQFEELLPQHKDLKVATGDTQALDAFARQLTSEGPLSSPGTLYLIDPLGHWMMRYPPGADPSKILKDLRRLLKVSQIG